MGTGIKIFFHTRGDTGGSVDEDLELLRKERDSGAKKDARKLRTAIVNWEMVGFNNPPQLDFRRIEGKTYDGKLWEARYLRSARSDGVHGYRLFYVTTRHPKTDETAVVLLTLYAKSGGDTTQGEIDDAWKYANEVFNLLERGELFEE